MPLLGSRLERLLHAAHELALHVVGVHVVGRDAEHAGDQPHDLAAHEPAVLFPRLGEARALRLHQGGAGEGILGTRARIRPCELPWPAALREGRRRDHGRGREPAARRLSGAHDHEQERHGVGRGRGERGLVQRQPTFQMCLEHTVDLRGLERRHEARHALAVRRRRGGAGKGRGHDGGHPVLHGVERHERRGHGGAGTVALARQKLQLREVDVAEGRDGARVAARGERRGEGEVGLGEGAYRHRPELERRVLEIEALQALAREGGAEGGRVAVDEARGVRRGALDKPDAERLRQRAGALGALDLERLLRGGAHVGAADEKARDVAGTQRVDCEHRGKRARQVARQGEDRARRPEGVDAVAHVQAERLPRPRLAAVVGKLQRLERRQRLAALDILHEQRLLKRGRGSHAAAGVVEHKRPARKDGLVEGAHGRQAGEPDALLARKAHRVAVGERRHGGRGLVRRVERRRQRKEHQVAAGGEHRHIARRVVRDGDAGSRDLEDGREPHLLQGTRAPRRVEAPERDGAPLAQQEGLQHGHVLHRHGGGHHGVDAERGEPAGEIGERAEERVLVVALLDEPAGRRAAKERGGRDEEVRPLVAGDARLALDAGADALDIAQPHVYLRKRDPHTPSPPRMGRGPPAGDPHPANRIYQYSEAPAGTRRRTELELLHPQPVQVAVRVHAAALNAAREERRRRLAGLERVDLQAAVRLERDPLDIVLRLHGVRDLAHLHVDDVTVALEVDGGHMLLLSGVDGVGLDGLEALGGAHARLDRGEEVTVRILKKHCHRGLLSKARLGLDL